MTAVETPAPFIVEKIRPALVAKGKATQRLGRATSLDMGVQVVAPDEGETNLHSHPGLDSAWVVLDGEALFYGENDEVVADLEKNEMIMIPAGTPYWFKSGPEKPLVILHIVSIQQGYTRQSRMDHRPRVQQRHDAFTGSHFEG
jgi:mannose-6-phosphate isomerase-like protein (cupin superfamily)